MYSVHPSPSRPFCMRYIQGNILFDIKVTGNAPGYREHTIQETCRRFINHITDSQEYIDFIEDTVNKDATLSITGVEDFKPQIIYDRHDLYGSEIYTLRPHAKIPLHIQMNITNFHLFKREVDWAYTYEAINVRSSKPSISILPTRAELLDFLA